MAKARKSSLAALAGACAVLGAPAMAQPPTTVLELFTSQGCSVCPPADEVFSHYAVRPDVLALTFDVDYWDYLGWKDTVATPDNGDRQKQYADARGDGQIYTPQVVVDGHSHVIGSDSQQIDMAIAANAGTLTVPITMSASDDAITVTVADAPASSTPHATVWMVMYDPTVSIAVQQGDNAGHTLTYSNVVRKIRAIAMWKGTALSVDVPRSEMARAKLVHGAVILQAERDDGLPGPVIGAATIELRPVVPAGGSTAAAAAAPLAPGAATPAPAPAR
jgi:hypothetical protein